MNHPSTPTELTRGHMETLTAMLANEHAGQGGTSTARLDRRRLPRLTKADLIEPTNPGSLRPERFRLTRKGRKLAAYIERVEREVAA